ncbi:MAG: hypothetical protein OEY80_05090, partial [Nitrospirota bacterium]|nr:hypothetical protein [Nitrospirota bacterium]
MMTSALTSMTQIHHPEELKRITQQLLPGTLSLLQPLSSIPLFLRCLGGCWEGRLIGWKDDCVQFRMSGFPPIEIAQNV